MNAKTFARPSAQLFLLSASVIAISQPATAREMLFSTHEGAQVQVGQRVNQTSGVTQIRLDDGAVLSFVDGADYRLNEDGSLDLYAGSVTVAGGTGQTVVRMPEGVEGRVAGAHSAASFSVAADGTSRGHALTGQVDVLRGGNSRRFEAGQMWAAGDGDGLRRVVSNGAQNAPDVDGPGAEEARPQVADMGMGGPLAAAENGLPVSLGDALAAAGASADIVGAGRRVHLAAGNPDIDAFPTGDLALLISYAGQMEALNDGTPFPGARADIIRTYLGFLADGGQGGNFLSAYSGVLVQYLDLLRAGGLPSGFTGASRADLEAWLAYAGRTNRFAALSAQNRALVDAYVAFLAEGGNPNRFARSYTDLVNAYFGFLRAGGDAQQFAGASQQTLDGYIRFLAESGLSAQLAAADRELLQAYLANGGLAFTSQYRASLNAWFAAQAGGTLPTDYAALDPAAVQAYLERLQESGLFASVLGDRAEFFDAYLAHLQAGGDPDGFAGLNANIFAGYGSALAAYYDYLLRGGVPTEYEGLTQAQVAAWVAAINAAGTGATGVYLGDLAEFYGAYAAYLAGGGNPDIYTGLPVLNLPAFADALNAYAAFLAGGGLPSGYSSAQLAQLADYIAALARAGRTDDLLGTNAGLLTAYFEYLAGGGAIDRFAGLPVYLGYANALEAYYAYLAGGGLPQNYAALNAAQIRTYLAALSNAGVFTTRLGDLAGFFTQYYAFIESGGNPANFSGIPAYATYASALQAYYAFLAGGGLPGDYAALTPAQVRAYLAALDAAGGLTLQLGDLSGFFDAYYDFIAEGGNPANYAGLPAYAGYVSALQAYYAYLQGGGLPAGYTALTQAQVQAYLAALNAAGGFNLQLGASLSGFFADYFAFINGGGNPANYAGLPAYAGYVSALQAYYAYLQGGGLPAGYTALTQAQVQAYLAALNAAGGFNLQLGASLSGFFTDYFAFINGGGNPADYAGLPVYAGYLDAVQAFYAYLAGGGAPSAYTALTPAQVQAYLAALENVGLLADNFSGEQLDFYTGYLAWLVGGGLPDGYTGLPDGISNVFAGVNVWQYGASGSRRGAGHAADVEDDGQITRIRFAAPNPATLDYTGNGGVLEEQGRIGNSVAWSRYSFTGGTFPNRNDYLMTGAPAVALPASGTVDYHLVGGAAPTDAYAAAGTAGHFTGDIAVAFGSQVRVGIEMDVHAGQRGWHGETTGGIAGVATGGLLVDGDAAFTGTITASGIRGDACTAQCQIRVFGGLFGSGATEAGFVYTIDDRTGAPDARNFLTGLAIFGTGGTALIGIGTMPVVDPGIPAPVSLAYAGGFDPAAAKINFITSLRVGSGNVVMGSEIGFDTTAFTLNSAGGLTGYTRTGGTTRTTGTMTVAEPSGNADVLIGRWTNGTNTGGNPFTLTANQGLHYMLARPVQAGFTLPASGRIDYDLIAATRPTMLDGSVAPGGFTADMALLLGATTKVAFEAEITMPGANGGANLIRAFSTQGGIANAEESLTPLTSFAGGTFAFGVAGANRDGCTPTTCSLTVNGAFAGDSGQIGLTYQAIDAGGAAKSIIGSAAFGNGTLTGGTPTTTTVLDRVMVSDTGASDALDLSNSATALGTIGYEVNSAGEIVGLVQTAGFRLTDRIGTASNADSGGTTGGGLQWTRWTNGTLATTRIGAISPISFNANRGYHIITGAPLTNMPTTGRADYTLSGGTRPTSVAGTGAPGTLTSGSAAVLFGTTAKLGIELAFSQNGTAYAMQTVGGVANPGTSEITVPASGSFRQIGTYGTGVTVNGASCATCRPIWDGFLSGDAAAELGLQYTMQRNNGDRIIGTAGFVKTAAPPAPAVITGAQTGQHGVTANYANFQDIYGRATNYDANGVIDSYTISNGSTWARGNATAPAAESGSVAGFMGWARWTEGSTQNGNLTAKQGTHIISGTPATNVPTSGTVQYELIGSTRPTDGNGVNDPGTFAGTMAIDFAARKAGFDFDVAIGNYGWNLRTAGGSDNPANGGLDLYSEWQVKSQISITGTTAASCTSTCVAGLDGFAFGPGGTHFGVAYRITDRVSTNDLLWVSGAAAFRAVGAP